MTHFNLNPGMVRGDLFKVDGGKWKYTVQIDMDQENINGIHGITGPFYSYYNMHKAIYVAYIATPSTIRGVIDGLEKHDSFNLVVLDPYHQNSHPAMINLNWYYKKSLDN